MNKHECLVNSETATGEEQAECYQKRPHMEWYAGWCLKRPNGERVRLPRK